jgi:hypothetical protein
MRERIPENISSAVLELCRKIATNGVPEFIAITPEPGCEPNDCFMNVKQKVDQNGGRIQFGWALWECPQVFIEAEHHAVYDPPSGPPWRDITPCNRGNSKRLFLADDTAVYDFKDEGFRRDNIRCPLSDDPLIEEFFLAAKKRNDFMNDLPGVGEIVIHASEDKALQKLERRLARAKTAIEAKYGVK